MSDTPSGKRFVGFAFNKTTATESNVASDYAWSPLYDNVVVGGRNLFVIKDFNPVVTPYSTSTLLDTFPAEVGKSYTITTNIPPQNDPPTLYDLFFDNDGVPISSSTNGVGSNSPKTIVATGSLLEVAIRSQTFVNKIKSGEYWIKVEKGNIATDWTPAPEDVDAAIANAQTTADGKNAVFYQTSAPSTAGRKVNDLWFDTDDGNRIYIFNGTAWTPAPFGTNAIAQLAITNALIANGTIQDAKIANVTAAKIIANSLSAISANLGTIEAGHIGGVTLDLAGGKFIVDAFGNVTFKGNLDGASGTFSGKVTTPILDIENNGESGIRMLADKFGDYGAAAGLIKTIYTSATATYMLITGTNADDTAYNNDIIIDLDGKAVILGASPSTSPIGGSIVSVSDEFSVAGLAEFFGALRAHLNADFYAPAHFWADVESENNIRLRGDANVVATDRPWFAPTLLNGVSNLGSGYSTAAYTKEVTGRIRMKGFLQNSADNRVLFTLPVGFRPSERRVFICFSNHSTGRARVDIETNGNVTAVSSGGWVVLDGIEFPI